MANENSPLLDHLTNGEGNKDSRPSKLLMIYMGVLVVISVGNAITWKQTLNRYRSDNGLQTLEFFVSQWTILLYILLSAVVLFYRWFFTDLITDEQKAFPQKKFWLMGLLDAVTGLFSAIGGAYVAGQTQTLMNQATIPLTMWFSVCYLGTQYSRRQRLGALLIVVGAMVACLPMVIGSFDSSSTSLSSLSVLDQASPAPPLLSSTESSSSTLQATATDRAVSVVTVTAFGTGLFALSILPNAFSNIYKEVNLKGDSLDVYYLTTYETTYQLVLGFLVLPMLSLPQFGGTPMMELPSQITKGWSCFVGQEVAGYSCNESYSTYDTPSVLLLTYVAINFVYCTLLLIITQQGSAMYVVIASTLSMPLTNIAFSLSAVMGDEAEEFSPWNVVGLLLVVVGFLMYSLSYELNEEGTREFIPAQAAVGGQMPYIVDKFRARKSFDLHTTPSVAIHIRKPQVERPHALERNRSWT